MKNFKHHNYQTALVTLDLTEMDEHVIRYAAMISKILPLKRIFFLHVAKSLEFPEELIQRYPALMAPLDESIQADIEQKVKPYFQESDVKTECIVRDGAPIDKILKLANVKAVDLILMGRKKSLKGSGLVSSHIARKCPCSLLLVPENFKPELKKVLVPVDFSEHSALAVKQAELLTKNSSEDIALLHVYNVPAGYYKIGKTYEEFDEIISGHAKNDCAKFQKEHQFSADLKCSYLSSKLAENEKLVHTRAVEFGADLIAIGSRGRTTASSILMGSLAEKLVFHESDIPVLIVKNKGENMGFLEAILRL
ncbi:universal stress protein [Marinoscillum sp.]|uniref:universal stress protein n=1 Tax=Marinoscillum sp. TaxID=2024838 RepID=UPI003BAD212C